MEIVDVMLDPFRVGIAGCNLLANRLPTNSMTPPQASISPDVTGDIEAALG